MARMHLQRLAHTYIFRLSAGPRGFLKASRTLNSSCQMPNNPGINLLKDYPSWISSLPIPIQFDSIPHSAHDNQGWPSPQSFRHYCMKMINKVEVSVPKDTATENKPSTKKALEGAAKFNVVRVNDDGTWHHLSLRISELVSTVSLIIFKSFLLSNFTYILSLYGRSIVKSSCFQIPLVFFHFGAAALICSLVLLHGPTAGSILNLNPKPERRWLLYLSGDTSEGR